MRWLAMVRARQKIRCAFWRERRAGRCKAPRRRRCGDIVEERERRRCPPAAAPLRAAARRPAGGVARSLHTAAGMLVARALPAGLGASSKMYTLFPDGPLGPEKGAKLGETADAPAAGHIRLLALRIHKHFGQSRALRAGHLCPQRIPDM